jgi:ATP-dependent Clp protease protease subunit
VRIQLNELLRVEDLIKELLAKHTGQSLERLTKDFDRDYFMNAKDAVEYGIIDEVLGDSGEKKEEGTS